MDSATAGRASVTAEPCDRSPVERLNALLVSDLDAGFAEVVRAHKRVVHTVLLRACAHRGDAEDLTAEAFLRAYRALRGYDRERIEALRLRPWLLAIALNAWRNLARDRSRRPRQVPLDQAGEHADGPDAFDRVERRADDQRALARMIAALPEQQRVAVVLRHVCDLPASEVAEILAVPEGTARSLVSRGLRALRQGAGTVPHPVPTNVEEGS